MPSDLLPTKRELLLRRTLYSADGPASLTSRPRRLVPILALAALTLLWLLGAFASPTPHPITTLLREAKRKHAAAAAARPRSLGQAYAQYVALNGRLPPRGFDSWYALTVRLEACRLSGFKELRDSLQVWWALEPREIRARQDALGAEDHKKMGWVRVRDGHVHDWDEMVRRGYPTGVEDQVRHKGSRSAFEEMLQEVEREGGHLPDGEFMRRGAPPLRRRHRQWRVARGWKRLSRVLTPFPSCFEWICLSTTWTSRAW